MARRCSSISMDRRARVLVCRARGLTCQQAADEVGLGLRSVGQIRQNFGASHWDAALADLRRRIADGAQERGLFLRARQLIAGADPVHAAQEESDAEAALTWKDIHDAARDLFASRARTASGEERRRLQVLASPGYWAEAKVKAAESLGVDPDQLDGHPQILQALLAAVRGVRP